MSESFQFLEVKFSVYLNRRVFVMVPFYGGKALLQNLLGTSNTIDSDGASATPESNGESATLESDGEQR